jgi:hypothetical protein
MEVKGGPSKEKMKICPESLKEGYSEEFMAPLKNGIWRSRYITMNFINYVMNQL